MSYAEPKGAQSLKFVAVYADVVHVGDVLFVGVGACCSLLMLLMLTLLILLLLLVVVCDGLVVVIVKVALLTRVVTVVVVGGVGGDGYCTFVFLYYCISFCWR